MIPTKTRQMVRLVFELGDLVLISQWVSCDENQFELMPQLLREQLALITEFTLFSFGDTVITSDTLKQGEFKFQLYHGASDIYRELVV